MSSYQPVESRKASSSNETQAEFEFSSNDESSTVSSYHSMASSLSNIPNVVDNKPLSMSDSYEIAEISPTSPYKMNHEACIPQDVEEISPSHNPDYRTLLFSKVAPNTTLRTLTSFIRGGSILNMRRRNYGEILVTFVEAEAALNFLKYVKKNDLYIDQKRIEVTLHDVTYTLGEVVSRGLEEHHASRNIVLRDMYASMKGQLEPEEEVQALCDHLKHISDLEIVSVDTINGHTFISLNGIRQAINARHCISHTGKYRKVKVSHWLDECDGPLPQPVQKECQEREPFEYERKVSRPTYLNRFEPLFDSDTDSTCSSESA